MEEWLTIGQLAKLLGCSIPDAKQWLMRHGGIRFKTYKLTEPHYNGEDVRRLMEGNLFEKGAR